MAILNKYRTLAAALLVLLYAFVAMPVQWWHHHDAPGVNAKSAKHTNAAFSDDCPVCSHQYASHDGIAFVLTLSIPNTPNEFLADQLIVLPSLPSELFSNRGPPTLI